MGAKSVPDLYRSLTISIKKAKFFTIFEGLYLWLLKTFKVPIRFLKPVFSFWRVSIRRLRNVRCFASVTLIFTFNTKDKYSSIVENKIHDAKGIVQLIPLNLNLCQLHPFKIDAKISRFPLNKGRGSDTIQMYSIYLLVLCFFVFRCFI